MDRDPRDADPRESAEDYRPGEEAHEPPLADQLFPDTLPAREEFDGVLPPTEQLPVVPEPPSDVAPDDPTIVLRPEADEADLLPELSEITFEPPDEPPPVPAGLPGSGPAAAPPPPEPVDELAAARASAPSEPAPQLLRPKTLSKRRFATLIAAADALVPPGGDIPASAAEVGVAQRVDGSLAIWDPASRRIFERALTALEWSTVLSRALRPLSKLGHAPRIAALDRAQRSRVRARREALDVVRFACLNAYASSSAVETAIGFDYRCLTDAPVREPSPLEVVSYPLIDADHVETADAVVVGSGAGGAVVAKELAELGMSVVIVEEGGSFERTDFSGPPFERFQRLYRRQGLMRTVGSPPVSLPLGTGVGGTTLVSAGTCARTPDDVLERWTTERGLPGINPDAMRPFFDRIERAQRVQPVPEELLGANNNVLRAGAHRAGASGGRLLRTIEGCRGCGTCSYGCPTDANLSMRLTYLPRAQRAGAGIFANARVGRIVVEQGRAAGVVADLLDPVTRQPRARLTVRAPLVVIAAGAIHTPALLGRSALGNISGLLGRGLQLHPAAMVGAYFDDDVVPWLGTMQGFEVDEMAASHRVRIQATGTVPSVAAGTLPAVGLRAKEMLARSRSLATAAVFVADLDSGGRIVARGEEEPVVAYKMGEADAMRLAHGIVRCAELYLAAGARGVVTGLAGVGPITSAAQLHDIRPSDVRPRSLRLTGWHPVATARMGVDPASSVVDPWGALHGVAGLYVADASIVPECPGVNPQETVMALATRCADHIARTR